MAERELSTIQTPMEVIDPDLPGAMGLNLMPQAAMVLPTPAMAINELRERHQLLNQLISQILVDGSDYGKIPGCGDKPALLLPGAQKLSSAFRLAPRYQVVVNDLGGGNREYDIRCSLYSFNGLFLAEGLGTCSTLERKYRYRPGPVENTGKLVPKGYWDNRQSDPKKAQTFLGGPGFSAKKIDNQWMICRAGEIIENPDPADLWNTVKKMAAKRAFVAAVITATAASSTFTQDIEENPELYRRDDPMPEPPPPPPPPAREAPKSAPRSRPAATPPPAPEPPAPAPVPEDDYPFEDGPGTATESPTSAVIQGPTNETKPSQTPTAQGSTNEPPPKEKWNNVQFGAARQQIVRMRTAATNAGYASGATDRWLRKFDDDLGHIPYQEWMDWACDSLAQMEAKAGGAK